MRENDRTLKGKSLLTELFFIYATSIVYTAQMAKKKKKDTKSNTITLNKKARHDYLLEDKFEAGIALQGWEVKSLREGRVNLRDSYILLDKGEAYLFGTLITPLQTASTHITPDQTRTRKLLLHRQELNKLIGAVERKGYSIVPTAMYWVRGRAKIEIALAKGKKQHDKRATEKSRDWGREKARIMKSN